MKKYRNCTGETLLRAYKFLDFLLTGKTFTVQDIMVLFDAPYPTARRHIDAASMIFPIYEVEDHGRSFDGKITPTVYQYIKD